MDLALWIIRQKSPGLAASTPKYLVVFYGVTLGRGLRKSEEALPDSPCRAILKNGGVLPAAGALDKLNTRCQPAGRALQRCALACLVRGYLDNRQVAKGTLQLERPSKKVMHSIYRFHRNLYGLFMRAVVHSAHEQFR